MTYEIIIPVIAGAIRNIAGWLENSLKDGQIQGYEWGKLGSTILEVVILSVAALYGLNTSLETAAGLGVLGSFGLSALKKAGSK